MVHISKDGFVFFLDYLRSIVDTLPDGSGREDETDALCEELKISCGKTIDLLEEFERRCPEIVREIAKKKNANLKAQNYFRYPGAGG